ncbi:MAG TPA: D-hexose-6-phosphate mutarotase [Bacteroidales bacterium]|nr:D-hexose-6-phosphate mutarotase [Bacteroidales bacterium]
MVQSLNNKFAPRGNIFFKSGKGGHVYAKIDNRFAACEVSLYGAQVLSFEPHGEPDIIWLSKKSHYDKGKAIRGGIPVCFPWFGPHAEEKTYPQHGFARLIDWQVENVNNNPDGTTYIALYLCQNDFTKTYWPYDFEARVIITVGEQLKVELKVTNTGTEEFSYTDALHTYFHVSNIEDICVEGLMNAKFYNGPGATQLEAQNVEQLTITKEENRRYIGHSGACSFIDNGYNRKITIEKTGSNTTVLWNPWADTIKTMGDMPSDGYKNMLCIEPANAFNDIIALKAGESHTLSTIIGYSKY